MSKQKRLIEFDDFISSKIEIEQSANAEAEPELSDFSHVKVSKIDENVAKKITKKIQDIRQKLHKLKSVL